MRGRLGMEVKVDGDGWGWKQSLRGRVEMGVISVSVQVSSNGTELVIERSRVRLQVGALPVASVNSAFHPSRVGKSSTSLLAGVKAGRVHVCRVAGKTVIPYGR